MTTGNTFILPLFVSIFLALAIILFLVMYTSDRRKAKQLAEKRGPKPQTAMNNHYPPQSTQGRSKPANSAQAGSSGAAPSSAVKKPPGQNQGQAEAVSSPPLSTTPPTAEPQTPAKQAAVHTGNKFYVFVTQGRSFDTSGSPHEEVVIDKAQKLQADYPPAVSMELVIVNPGTWENPAAKVAAVAADKSATISSDEAIREYLTVKGVPGDVIEAGLKVSASCSLRLTNLGTGLSLVGIPIK